MPKRLSRELRLLRDAGSIDEDEYRDLLKLSRGRKKQTRKQRETSIRNLRRGCKKIMKPAKSRSESRIETKVKKLRSEINDTLKQERLKIELKELREQRKQIRDFKKSFRNSESSLL